jgi:ribonuclease HI
MIVHNPPPPSLRIWQQNLNKSLVAQQSLLQTAHSAANSFDIICIQEPYIDFKGNSRALRKWTACYPTPSLSLPEAERKRIRSIIFIRSDIKPDLWTQVEVNSLDVTAMAAHTTQGSFLIINVYNDCNHSASLDAVRALFESRRRSLPQDSHEEIILLGDFNRHHPLWDDPSNHHLFTRSNLRDAQLLLDLTADYDLHMALPASTPTLISMATKNYTRPDNVFVSDGVLELLLNCTTHPGDQPPSSDHIPIETTLELPLERLPPIKRLDFRKVDWEDFRKSLDQHLNSHNIPREVHNRSSFNDLLTILYDAIQGAISQNVPLVHVSTYAKRWWDKTLEILRSETRRLGRKAHRHRGDRNNPTHEEYRISRNRYSQLIKYSSKDHWIDFMEEMISRGMWVAHRIVSATPTDGSNIRIPPLEIPQPNGLPLVAKSNREKAEALLDAFFPPPSPLASEFDTSDYTYPDQAFNYVPISDDQIRRAINRLLPYKATHSNNVSNAVLKNCSDSLIPILGPLFRASLSLPYYPEQWRNSSIIVLRKPGKPNYRIPKAYRPIELLCSIGKVLSSVVAEDIIRASDRLGLLPSHQFGSRPGRATTDALHLAVTWIKNQWRKGNVVSGLFLDVKGAFPSIVVNRLAHDMRTRGVPKTYTDWITAKGEPRVSSLTFDGYQSDPLPISVGLPQGCPLSPLCFAFYNAALNDVPNRRKTEEGFLYVDDTSYLTGAKNFKKANRKLHHMMTKRKGAIAWTRDHNSEFEISKSVLVGFTHKREKDPLNQGKTRLIPCPPLRINGQEVPVKDHHKFLGVILDRTLSFKEQGAAAIAKGDYFISAFRRLAKPTVGVPPRIFRHFYLAVAVPRMLYAASIWLTPPPQTRGIRQSKGIMNKLQSIQRKAAILVTGAMRTSPTDSLDAHANLLPLPLLAAKICHRELMRIACVPATNPVRPLLDRAARRLVKSHRSPLHILPHIFHINPALMESIPPVRLPANWSPRQLAFIPGDKASAKAAALTINEPIVAYSDGSCINNGVGAAAEMYCNGTLTSSATFFLGPETEHTVFESELIGILMALGMILQTDTSTTSAVIGLDSQAAIRATFLHHSASASYILDHITQSIDDLIAQRPNFSLRLQWIPGHVGITQNESVDAKAKTAAEGRSSAISFLPPSPFRPGQLPRSKAAGLADFSRQLKAAASHELTLSPRYRRIADIDRSSPSNRFQKLVDGLPRKQAALLYQLRSGHVPLNYHLHRIGKADSPACDKCGFHRETVLHFLTQCPAYSAQRAILSQKLGHHARSVPFLLANKTSLTPLFRFISTSRRFNSTFRNLLHRKRLRDQAHTQNINEE